jgi:DNA methylase
MTTDPGDLVFDPTCGSGTTAYVSEQWGRRWVTIDTSRVPLALARQRLLTATFPWYELEDEARGPAAGSQAFFPRTSAWESLKKALKGEYEESVWDHLAGTTSAPFEAGEQRQVAVKVIDDRGHELIVIEKL